MDEAPRVTVTDPSRDVVVSGDEREPFRASRRQKAAVAGAVAVALVVAGVVQVVRHQREQDRLDAAALKQVVLAVITPVEGGDTPEDVVRLAVRNDTPTRVHLDTLTIDLPGVEPVRIDRDAIAAEIVNVDVKDTLTCSPDIADLTRSVSATLAVTTDRGTSGTVKVTLLSDAVNFLLSGAQDRCRYYPTDRAVRVVGGEGARAGRTVVTTLQVSNGGLPPLTLTGISGPAGFTVKADRAFPLTLPPSTLDANGQPDFTELPLTVTIGIDDCAVAGDAVTSTEVDPTFVLNADGATGSADVGFQPGFDTAPVAALFGALCT